MSRKYLIGTGYHRNAGLASGEKTGGLAPEHFFDLWLANTERHSAAFTAVMASGDGPRPNKIPLRVKWMDFVSDLGHVHDLNNHRKPYHWCGWSISFVTLALIAYFDESDFIFKESDVLAFGPWVDRMYDEIGNAGMIFGKAKCMPAVQSLVLCKHEFIPEFVRLFMGTGSEQIKSNEGELKFARLEQQNPGKFARYSFGVDRDRPLPYDDEVWYAQHWTSNELAELCCRNLI